MLVITTVSEDTPGAMREDETTDPAGSVDVPASTDRYADLSLGDDAFVVYDRRNHQAWIQSSSAVAVDELR